MPRLLCTRHWDRDERRPAAPREHPYRRGEYFPALCEDCLANDYDEQQERDFKAYHGGDTPFNDAERASVRR